MIKTFEEFDNYIIKNTGNITNEDLAEMLSTIALIWNHSILQTPMYNKFEQMCEFLDRNPWNFINVNNGMFDWSDNYDWDSLTKDDRIVIAELYKRVVNEFDLYNFPKMDDLDEVFTPIKDLTEVELTIDLDNKLMLFDINTIPSVKTFPDKKIKANFEEWDSITQEISPAINRILDLGYSCDFFIKSHGRVQLSVFV